MDIYKVELSKNVIKDLKCLPKHIVLKLGSWIELVAESGLKAAQKIPGYHDEPLKGNRKGQRSIRLNRAYRAIYVIDESNKIHFVSVVEVNKHEY
ncbi:MAG: type II toxin-antitoxin system mRNA interferase toxin, RelE/StbE family [Legionellales bacterium]|nr:type II toxin-antitoxin system mRNA interferase toxin, RelE/StbE family [Legionellales bacterium]